MTVQIISSYILIIMGVCVWVVLIPKGRKISAQWMQYISIFGGAFLFASCFINLVPHIFIGPGESPFLTPDGHFKVAASVMVGFLIQLILEQATRGIEHGHNHCACCQEEASPATVHQHEGPCHHSHTHPIIGLMIGLCIHAFLEGMPMVDGEGDIHRGLLYGIVLHNIPIALVLVSIFASNRFSLLKSALLLFAFGIMTPLGSLCNLYLIPENETLQCLIMGMVVGILLHVSVSILFDHDHNQFSWNKLALILIAFVAAYLTPGCPEIYPM